MLLSAAILMSDIIVCVMDFEKDTGMKKKDNLVTFII